MVWTVLVLEERMKKKVALHNLGCKVNSYELEAMQQLLEQAGYEIVPFEPGADVYVINTCTVTNIADRKSRQMLHKAKKMNPDAVVVATGCYVQTDEGKLEKDEAVDLVLGNNQKKNIVEVLTDFEKEHQRQAHIIKINQTKEYEELEISRTEVVLTGIHLSSYGVDFPEDNKETLLSLIQAVNEVEGIQRIRLGSLEPGIVTEEFAKELSSMPKVCPHFHLSLQSGCDTTLERMNRRYRSAEYKARCELLRKYFGNPALTTDVIVGFPMETEEDFQASYDFVKDIHFYETHIFKYSRRHGTKAAAMSGQLTEAEKAVRSDKMLELHQKRAAEYETSLLGKTLEVLLEEEVEIDGKAYYLGHSREYVKVAVLKTEEYGVNDILAVKVEEALQPHILQGEEVQVL